MLKHVRTFVVKRKEHPKNKTEMRKDKKQVRSEQEKGKLNTSLELAQKILFVCIFVWLFVFICILTS